MKNLWTTNNDVLQNTSHVLEIEYAYKILYTKYILLYFITMFTAMQFPHKIWNMKYGWPIPIYYYIGPYKPQNISYKNYFWFTDLPKEGPTIETPRKQYQVGETADLMCIAQISNPSSNLSWYINGEPVSWKNHKIISHNKDIFFCTFLL